MASPKEIIRDVKQGKIAPIYFLHGEEEFYIDEIADFIEANTLSEDQKAFNQTILYGKDTDFKQVLDAARRYPMLAERQLVVLKEAQSMRSLDQLEAYVKNPLPTTLLLILHKHKKLDSRKKLGKSLKVAEKAGKAVLFESKKPYENELPNWIRNYLKDKGAQIEEEAGLLLAEYLGNDLSKIANELEKLLINHPKGQLIGKAEIEKNIGISKDYNVFELQSALAQKDALKAQRIVKYYQANPKAGPLPMLTGVLYNFFSKAYICRFLSNLDDVSIAGAIGQRAYGRPGQKTKRFADYRHVQKNYALPHLEEVIALLKIYDLRSKGVGWPQVGDFFNEQTESGQLLQELVSRILQID
ncbi:DNA polymerase III, delta subunit [Saprospira grandis DSM 2844]|uniref:DNA polymerase III, delta subunit n=1 Tax=Saprospira grandis DSM 2844 TaxID=694433 RepID=J1I0K3_9BACT|nr:DNA polymerase III subunit delta [Saprospira grandis]EJF52175.1 DNA polymerase III, delta subunit [Saprospira grandis DSM 2844]